MRQAARMRYLADGIVLAGKVAIADFVAPTKKARAEFDPDFTVWMDTINKSNCVNGPAAPGSTFEQTDAMFQSPAKCDYHVSAWFKNTHEELLPLAKKWMEKNV
jgi:hypothetical protein